MYLGPWIESFVAGRCCCQPSPNTNMSLQPPGGRGTAPGGGALVELTSLRRLDMEGSKHGVLLLVVLRHDIFCRRHGRPVSMVLAPLTALVNALAASAVPTLPVWQPCALSQLCRASLPWPVSKVWPIRDVSFCKLSTYGETSAAFQQHIFGALRRRASLIPRVLSTRPAGGGTFTAQGADLLLAIT